MSSQINAVQRFFEYLSKNNLTIEDVQNDADTNGDGAIKKAELKKWLNNNPDLNVTASEMTQIFNMFNKNKGKTKINGTKVKEKNGLSESEMNAMAEKLAAYQAVKASIDEVFAGNGDIDIPDELLPYVMSARSSVEESVLAKMNSNFEIPNMTELLTIAIAKTGANGLGQALFNEALSDNASVLPAGYAGGDDFQSVLNSYIKSLGSSVDLDSINEDVDSLVDDFFASAGFGGSDIDAGDPLYPYSWKSSMGLNDLQIAVLTKKLTDALGPTAANFANYQADFNDAANGFIKDKLASSNDFDTLNTAFNNSSQIASEFQGSRFYKALEVIINYTDFSESQHTGSINDLYYEALETNFGAEFAKNLSEADVTYKDGELYNTVIRQVMQMVLNGELTTDDQIRNKIIELIVAKYEQFCTDLGIGSSSASLEDLKNNVDTLYNNGAQLEAVRTAAIAFLNAAHALGNEQLDYTIKAEFGDNYKDTVNTLRLASVIKNKVSIVMAKYNDLTANGTIATPVDPSTLSATWSVGQIPTLQVGGDVTTLACSATVKDANGNPISSSTDNAITYAVTTTGGNTGSTVAINSDTGELSMTPGSRDGILTIKVKVMLNGVEVGTKEISVEVKKAPSIEDAAFDSNDSSEHLEVWNTAGTTDNTQVTDYNFIDLYNNNACICLHREMDTYHSGDGFDGSWSANASIVKQRLGELGTYVVHALSNAGYDGSILERAKTNVVNRWATQNMVDRHVNDRGTDSTALCTNAASYLNDKGEYQGIVNGVDTDGNDSNVYMVSFKAFVDAILEEYNRLI